MANWACKVGENYRAKTKQPKPDESKRLRAMGVQEQNQISPV